MIRFTVMILDASEDRFLLTRSLRFCSQLVLIGKFSDSESLLTYLSGEGAFRNRFLCPVPDLLLMDASKTIQSKDTLSKLIDCPQPNMKVVVFAGSTSECNELSQFGPHACYRKTDSVNTFKEIVEKVVNHLVNGDFTDR